WARAVRRWRRLRGDDDRRRVKILTPVVLLSGLACAAAPLGFGIYRFVIESTARSIAVRIDEWFPVLPTSFFGVLFWAATLAFVALIFFRGRKLVVGDAAVRSDFRDWVIVATALALLPLAARAFPNTAPLVLFAGPAAAPPPD